MIRIKNTAKLVAVTILAASSLLQIANTAKSEEVAHKSSIFFQEEEDIKCLAKNIYYESKGEPKEGKIAVGIVTLNRVNHPKFPDTVCEVVNHKTKTNSGKYICQFSWVCQRKKPPKESDQSWQESLSIASNLLDGEYKIHRQKYKRVHYFHNATVNPRWNLTRVARVGRHVFYN